MKKLIICLAILQIGAALPDFEKLADTIFKIEGGFRASTPYGIQFKGCSWENPAYCRRICLNTLKNQYERWRKTGDYPTYFESLWHRYAPPKSHPLNKNWLNNLLDRWEEVEVG